jgi:serine/threonine protein kinase
MSLERQVTDFDRRVFARFPQPVALAWKRVFARTEAGLEEEDVTRAMRALGRTLSAQLLADLGRGDTPARVRGLLERTATHPLSCVGWWALVPLLLQSLAARRDPSPFVRRAVAWYFNSSGKPSAHAKLVHEVLGLRVNRSGQYEVAGVVSPTLVDDARRVLLSLDWWLAYRIVQVRGEGGHVRVFAGESLSPSWEAAAWTARLDPERLYLQHADEAGGILDLSPWMQVSDDGGAAKVAVFHDVDRGGELLLRFEHDGPIVSVRHPAQLEAALVPSPQRWQPNTPSGALVAQRPLGAAWQQRFQVIATIGRGGYAVVYRALDTTTQGEVAIKRFHPDLGSSKVERQRLAAEARRTHSVPPRYVVTATPHELGDELVLSMPLLAGSLEAYVKPPGLPEPEVWRRAEELAEALHAIHAEGITHCDIKPSNVLIDRHGHAYLSDFGIAIQHTEDELGRLGPALGTPAYRAPEQQLGRAEPKSDVWALGRLLHDLARGRVEATLRPGEGIDGELGRFLRWLGEGPIGRRPSSREVLEALRYRRAGPRVASPVRATLAETLRTALESGAPLPSEVSERLAAAQHENRSAAERWDELRQRHLRVAWPHLRASLTLSDLALPIGFLPHKLADLLERRVLTAEAHEALRLARGDAARFREPPLAGIPTSLFSLSTLLEARHAHTTPVKPAAVWRVVLKGLGLPEPETPTTAHALEALGVSKHELRTGEAVSRPDAPMSLTYTRVGIPKRDGRLRWLHQPSPRLAAVQRGLHRVLTWGAHMPPHAVAFVPGRSPLFHALHHAGAEAAVVVDIHDFFGSVTAAQIERALLEGPCEGWDKFDLEALVLLTTVRHASRALPFLPQGAPTSPLLANLVGLALDRAILHDLARNPWSSSWTYSRYADDLVISARRGGHHFHELAEQLLKRHIRRMGWVPSPQKTKHFSSLRGPGLSLCGVDVPTTPDGAVSLPREVRRRLRAAMHAASRGQVSPELRGLLAYGYSMTGKHAYAVAVPGTARKLVEGIARAMNESVRPFVEAWLG